MKASNAGESDPYWYEWSVGLLHLVKMLHPDSNIESVEFQASGVKGWDDVVVRENSGVTKYLQVKHSRNETNLTFGSLVGADEDGNSLMSSLFDSWKKMRITGASDKYSLLTNREAGSRKSKNQSTGHSRPSLLDFLKWLKTQCSKHTKIVDFTPKKGWRDAWKEFIKQLASGTPDEQIQFLNELEITTSFDDLETLEQTILKELQSVFQISQKQAEPLLNSLDTALRKWSGSRHRSPVTVEMAYKELAFSSSEDFTCYAPPPPEPFFPSRDTIIRKLESELKNRYEKVFFLVGQPGAGKTSLISHLTMRPADGVFEGLIGLRYFCFRPITISSPIIPADADMHTKPDRLWYSLLDQLRTALSGRLQKYSVPIKNEFIPWNIAREHVLRISDTLGQELKRHFTIVIDGIDHAARAAQTRPIESAEFFKSLPSPDELKDTSVRLIVAGQPAEAYAQYPHWLKVKRKDVREIKVGILSDHDIRILLENTNPDILKNTGDTAVQIIHKFTKGNTLSAVFAAEEARDCKDCETLSDRLKNRRLIDGLNEYYTSIWNHAFSQKTSNTDSAGIVALLLSSSFERISPLQLKDIQSSPDVTEDICLTTLENLSPLLVSEQDGYRIRHNDVRVFLSGILETYSIKKRQAMIEKLINYHKLPSSNRLASHLSLYQLVIASSSPHSWARIFDSHWVFEASSLSIPYSELQEECAFAIESAVELEDWDLLFEVTCAAECLEAWEERCQVQEVSYHDSSIIQVVPFLRTEGHVLPREHWNFKELRELFSDADILIEADENDRARSLIRRWFGVIKYSSFLESMIRLCKNDDPEEAYEASRGEMEFLQNIGRIFRSVNFTFLTNEINAELHEASYHFEHGWIESSCSSLDNTALDDCFGNWKIRFYQNIEFACKLLAKNEAWNILRELLDSIGSDLSNFSERHKARLPLWALKTQCENFTQWIAVLNEPNFGISEFEETDIRLALDLARSIGWSSSHIEPSSIADKVGTAYFNNRPQNQIVLASLRASALLGKVEYSQSKKAPEGSIELVTAREVGIIIRSLWSTNDQHDYPLPAFNENAGVVALELVKRTVVLGDDFVAELTSAAETFENFPIDHRLDSIWELHLRVGKRARLSKFLEYWLGKDGCLWDYSDLDETLNTLTPLAHSIDESKLAESAQERAAWMRIFYRSHKDDRFRVAINWLNALGRERPKAWRDQGTRLLSLSDQAGEMGSDNRNNYELDVLIGSLAIESGADDLRRLAWIDEPLVGHSQLYRITNRVLVGAISYLERKTNLDHDQAISIWCLSLAFIRWFDAADISRLNDIKKHLLNATNPLETEKIDASLKSISPSYYIETQSITESGENQLESDSDYNIETLLDRFKNSDQILPSEAAALVQFLQMNTPKDYRALLSKAVSSVGSCHEYITSWWYIDKNVQESLNLIFQYSTNHDHWKLVEAATRGKKSGSNWLQAVTENLFEVLLARAQFKGEKELTRGLHRIENLHESWIRGGKALNKVSLLNLPTEDQGLTWPQAALHVIELVLSSKSSEVVSTGITSFQAITKAFPELISYAFDRWKDDTWLLRWWLHCAETWADFASEIISEIIPKLESCSKAGPLQLRLQAWISLILIEMINSSRASLFPKNDNYQSKPFIFTAQTDLPQFNGPLNSARFINRWEGTESRIMRIEQSMGVRLDDIRSKLATMLRDLPPEEKPTSFPQNLADNGDILCSQLDVAPLMSEVFEQKLADQELAPPALIRFAQGFLVNEDPWITINPPRIADNIEKWPTDPELPRYGDIENQALLKTKFSNLARIEQVKDDEIVVGAIVRSFSSSHDIVYQFWHNESNRDIDLVSHTNAPTTLSGRSFMWYLTPWFEPNYDIGKRPMTFFSGGLQQLHHCQFEIVPSRIWVSLFNWFPSPVTPLVWMNGDKEVARYEITHGPVQSTDRAHYRQNVMHRWIIKREAWELAKSRISGELIELNNFDVSKSDIT